MTRKKFAIDDAPGKALLEPIRNVADLDAFVEFYRLRCDWWKYPLIHDYMVTYSIFDDLTNNLDRNTKAFLLPKAVNLAEDESDKLFLCAVYLMLVLADGFVLLSDQDGIRQKIQALLHRAKKLSLFPNMSCFWNQLARKVSTNMNSQQMRIEDEDWKSFISLNLPLADDMDWQNCPGGEDAIKKHVAVIRGGDFALEYLRNAVYDGSKYWIWLYRNISKKPIYHWYFYIVTTPDGKSSTYSHSMHTVVSITPEELIVRHSYGLIGKPRV